MIENTSLTYYRCKICCHIGVNYLRYYSG